MTHRGPFQPLPFCDSVKQLGSAQGRKAPFPAAASAAGLPAGEVWQFAGLGYLGPGISLPVVSTAQVHG